MSKRTRKKKPQPKPTAEDNATIEVAVAPIEDTPIEIPEVEVEPVASNGKIVEVENKIEPKPDPVIDKYLQLADACRKLPDAQLNPTDRWYGETFYPTYNIQLQKIRALTD